MAKKVSSPGKIQLKTSKTMIRSTKPRSEKMSRDTTDARWKNGLNPGTSLEDYRLDLMKLN